MDRGCRLLQTSVTSRLHTAHHYLFPIRIAKSPYLPSHSTNLTTRLYSTEKEDPNLVSQPEMSTHQLSMKRSGLPWLSVAPSNVEGRLTGASTPPVTSKDVLWLSCTGQARSETLDRLCHVLRGNRRFIKNLEVFYKAGAADIADVETVFQDYKEKCILLHKRMENVKKATGLQLLIESGELVLDKIVRTFFTREQVEPPSPLHASAAEDSGRSRDLFYSTVDFIRNAEFIDKAGLEKFLAEYPDLEETLNTLVYVSMGMELTAIAPFTLGTCEYDNVTIDILLRALDDAFPAEEFGDDVRQPFKTLLKCLQDLSIRLDENLFV